jgi:hypothetical protein
MPTQRTFNDIFSILCALLIEQMKPLRADNQIYAEIKRLAMRIETWFNAGQVEPWPHGLVPDDGDPDGADGR